MPTPAQEKNILQHPVNPQELPSLGVHLGANSTVPTAPHTCESKVHAAALGLLGFTGETTLMQERRNGRVGKEMKARVEEKRRLRVFT